MYACSSCRAPIRPGACPSCGALLAVGIALASPAHATEVEAIYGAPRSAVQFSPDRPGVGDSTGTPGKGHVMIEGGVALVPSPLAFGTSGIVGRIGVDDGLELRLRAPDVTVADDVGLGTVGLGAKVAASVGPRWSVSAVPELVYDPSSGALGGGVGANVALGLGRVGFWGHGSVSVLQDADPSVLFGGGASVAFDGGGLYVNGGSDVAGSGFVGGGGWWSLSKSAQLDAGCDAWMAGGEVTPVFLLGTSLGF
ncbi:MAG: zinc ribbon domain-containing protein [Myxococcota bacterium]